MSEYRYIESEANKMPNNDNFIKDIDDVVSNIESSTNIEVPEGCNIISVFSIILI